MIQWQLRATLAPDADLDNYWYAVMVQAGASGVYIDIDFWQHFADNLVKKVKQVNHGVPIPTILKLVSG
jgi:hypothetical protein